MRTSLLSKPLASLLSLALLLLAACSGSERAARTDGKGPALWSVSKGGLEAHIFGTIHVLPADVAWETPRMKQTVAASDRLVLEAKGLDDAAASRAIFENLGKSPDLPPLYRRVPLQDRRKLVNLIGASGASTRSLDGYESWAAALLVSSIVQGKLDVSGDQGVEPALTQDFRAAGKPVDGLETVAAQFDLFDQLPEEVQDRMLSDAVREADHARATYDRMFRAWSNGDMGAIERDFVRQIAPEPELAKALLTDRNRLWADEIAHMRGRPFIAVGAAHLAGPDNLIDLLRERGFTIARVQ